MVPTIEYKENNGGDYGYTDFAGGSFRIFVIPSKANTAESSGLPISVNQVSELNKLMEGEYKDLEIEGFTIGPDETPVLFRFTRLPQLNIDGYNWDVFEVTNNYENHGARNMYFVTKNSFPCLPILFCR